MVRVRGARPPPVTLFLLSALWVVHFLSEPLYVNILEVNQVFFLRTKFCTYLVNVVNA
jgi:hypothetical protein